MSRIHSRHTHDYAGHTSGKKRKFQVYGRENMTSHLIRNTAAVSRTLTPKQKAFHLRMAFRWTTTHAGDTTAKYQTIVANDMKDPLEAGGTAQPYGFDQLMTFYNHFTVTHSKCTLVYRADAVANQVPTEYGIVITETAASPSLNSLTFIEHQETSELGCGGGAADVTNAKVCTLSWNAKKQFGVNPVGGSVYAGSAGAAPSDTAYFQVCEFPTATTSYSYPYTVIVDYYGIATDPKRFSASVDS